MEKSTATKIDSFNNSNESPFFIYCKDCGSPADYDIKTSNYHCQSCGSNTELSVSFEQFRKKRKIQRTEIKNEIKNHPNISYTCPSCSATVLIMESEANASCSFCGSKIVRNSYLDQDKLPEVIIPFKITEQEAKKILQDWIEKNSNCPETKILKQNINKIRAFYLPYEMIRGPVSCTVSRDNSFRKYTCGGFVDGMVVNASKEFNNAMLDNIEPFNWIDCRPFRFSYIAGIITKIRDLQTNEVEQRIHEEVCTEYRTEVNKILQNKGTQIKADLTKTFTVPALMPVYLIGNSKTVAMINGQTGRLALKRIKQKTENIWYIKPTIITLLIMIITYLIVPDLQLTTMMGLVAGIICFAIFSQGKKVIKRDVYLSNDIIDSVRKSPNNIEYVYGKDKEIHKIKEPIFFEPIDGIMKPVKIKFYSLGRFLKLITTAILLIGLPNIIAILIAIAKNIPLSDLNHIYAAAWYTMVVPCCFIIYIFYGEQGIYDSPDIFEILSNGKLKRYKPSKNQNKNIESQNEITEHLQDKIKNQKTKPIFIQNVQKLIADTGTLKAGCLAIGFILFMLFGSVGVILHKNDNSSSSQQTNVSQQNETQTKNEKKN